MQNGLWLFHLCVSNFFKLSHSQLDLQQINITSYIGIFGCILILNQNFYLEKYSKSKQTKYSGFVRLGVRWAERDTSVWSNYFCQKLSAAFSYCFPQIKKIPPRNKAFYLQGFDLWWRALHVPGNKFR